MSEEIIIADLLLGVDVEHPSDTLIDRTVQNFQNALRGKKIELPVTIPDAQQLPTLRSMREEVKALAGEGVKANREQAAAAKALEAQYRATAAESAASTAKIREQQAQVALSSKLSAQAEREAQNAVREAARQAGEARKQAAADARAQAQAARESAQAQRDAARLATQAEREAARARKEAIDTQILAYANLRKELNQNRISEAQFNQGGDAIIATLQQMAQQAGYTAKELTRVTNLEDRIGREQNTLAGVINPIGFSGNMVSGLQSALPGILRGLQQISAVSPSLGAASNFLGTLETAMNGAGTASKFLGGAAGGAQTAVTGMGAASGVAAGIVGGVLVMGLVAAAGAMNKATDEAGRLQFEMAKVSTLTDKFPSQLGAAGREVLNISRELGMSYQDIAEGLNKAIGASVRGTEDMAQALEFTEAAGKLAVAGNTSTAASVDLLSSVMNAYKLGAADTTKVSDGLFAAIRDGKMEVNELTQSMGNVTAISADLGVPLEVVNASLATMTANGIKTSSAVDYLRSMFSAIQKPSSEAATLADNLSLKFDAQALASKGLVKFLQDVITATKGNKEQMAILFGGVEALSAVTSIASGNFERMKTNLDNQAKSAGSTETAYEKMMGTLKKENDRFDANWKSVWANLGEYMVPFKTEFMSFMNDALEKLNQFLQKSNAARSANKAQENLDGLRAQLKNAESGPLGKQEILKHLAQAKESGVQSVIDNWTRKLAQVDNEIIVLRGKIKEAETAAAQARADQAAANGPFAGPSLPTGNVLQDIGVKGRTVTQQFGITANSQRMKGRPGYEDGTHKGLDVALPVGTKLFSPNEVRILAAKTGWNDGLGNFIKMLDEQGNTILLAHLSKLSEEAIKAAKSGATLKKGTLVGLSGNSGQSSGPHVHIETRDAGGRAFNPLIYGGSASPTSSGTNTNALSGDDSDGPVTASMLARARELQATLEKTQKAAQAKPGDNALALAYGKAKAALEGWTGASKAHEKALELVRETQDKATRSTSDYVATQKDIAKYGTEALRLYKDVEKAQKGGNAQEIAAANTALNTWLGSSKVKKAVLEDEKKAYESRQALAKKDKTDAETAAKNRLKTQQDLQDALLKGKTEEAQRLLEQAKRQQRVELDLAKDSATRRAEVIRQTAPAILAAEDKLAELKRRAAVTANQRAYDEGSKLPGADLTTLRATQKARNLEAYATEKADREKARAEQADAQRQANQTALQAQQRHERERKALIAQAAREARQLRYEEADATLARVRNDNRAELESFKGTAAEKLALIRRQTQEEFEAAELVARIKRNNALRDNDNNTAQTKANHDARERQIKQAYTDTLTGLQNTRATAVRTGTEAIAAEGRAVADLIQRYRDLQAALQAKADAGTVTGDDLVKYGRDLASLWEQAGKAGVKTLPQLKAAHDEARAFGQEAQGLSDTVVEWANQLDATAKGTQDYLQSLRDDLKNIEGMSEDGLIELYNRAVATRDQTLVQETWDAINRERDRQKAEDAQYLDWLKQQGLVSGNEMDYSWGNDFQTTQVPDGNGGTTEVNTPSTAPADPNVARNETAQNLLNTLSKLNAATLQNADSVEFYTNMIKGAGGESGLTEQQVDDLAASLTVLQQAANLSADDFDVMRQSLLDAMEDGKLTKQELADLMQQIQLLQDAAAEGVQFTVTATDENGQTLSSSKLPEPASFEAMKKTAAALQESMQTDALLTSDSTEEVKKQVDVWQQIIDNRVQAKEISVAQGEELKRNLDLIVRSAEATRSMTGVQLQGQLAQLERDKAEKKITENFYLHEKERLEILIENERYRVAIIGKTDKEIEVLAAQHQQNLKDIESRGRAARGQADEQGKRALEDARDEQQSLTRRSEQRKAAWRHDLTAQLGFLKEQEDQERLAAQRSFERETEGLDQTSDAYKAAAIRLQNEQTRIAEEGTAARIALIQSEFEWYAQMADQVLGALGKLAQAMSQTEQQYDKTGKALNTPWTDLAANIEGAQKAIALAVDMSKDVAKLVASGGADIGAWISLATKVVSAIADALSGFKKAYADAQRMRDDFATSNPYLNAPDFQKVSVQSRGWLADIFVGPKVINEIDKVGVQFANSFAQHVADGFTAGLKKAVMEGDTSQIGKNLRINTFEGIVDGMIDSFKTEVIKEIMAPFLKEWAAAMKTPDTADDLAALNTLDALMPRLDQAGQAWANNVVPRLQSIQQKWGLEPGSPGGPSGSLFGNAPAAQLGIPRIEVSFPEGTFKPLADFAATIPRWESITARLETALAERVNNSPGLPESGDVAMRGLSTFAASMPTWVNSLPVFAEGAADLRAGAGELRTTNTELRQAISEWREVMRQTPQGINLPPLSGNGGLA